MKPNNVSKQTETYTRNCDTDNAPDPQKIIITGDNKESSSNNEKE